MSAPANFTAHLIESKPLSSDVLHLTLEAQPPAKLDFGPGQHVRMTIAAPGAFEDRYYSIASAPRDDNRFELCLTAGPDRAGRFLASLAPGARLACRGGAGNFGLREPVCDSLFIGHGTGVAPLRSMIEHLIGGPQDRSEGRKLRLLYGVRSSERIYFGKRLSELAATHENFAFLPTCSRPNPNWTGLRGRVQAHLEQALAGLDEGFNVYLCGLQHMVDDLRERLLAAGVDDSAIVFEQY